MYLESTKYFKNIADIEPKATLVSGHQFPKLTVKVRNEIVVLGEKVTQEEVKNIKKNYRQKNSREFLTRKIRIISFSICAMIMNIVWGILNELFLLVL